MTATQKILSKRIKKKADEENLVLACMDNLSQFGPVLHRLNFSTAIKIKRLSDYRLIVVGINDESTKEYIHNRSILNIQHDLNIDAESLANHIAAIKAIKDYKLKAHSIISYKSRLRERICRTNLLGSRLDHQ